MRRFFLQAEDGIRDVAVTGVQTCALPIFQAALAQSQNAQTQNQYNYAPQRVPGPSPLNQMENAKKVKGAVAAAPPSPEPPPSAVSSFSNPASLEVARAISNPRLISPPGSNVMWLAGRSGLIEFSGDGGASWSRQTSGVPAELLGGFPPPDKNRRNASPPAGLPPTPEGRARRA